LELASGLGRVLFTQDDLLAEAAHRQHQGQMFGGVIYAHQLRISVGDYVRDLELVAKAGEPADMAGRTLFLPL
jgi:hypothetical protein